MKETRYYVSDYAYIDNIDNTEYNIDNILRQRLTSLNHFSLFLSIRHWHELRH